MIEIFEHEVADVNRISIHLVVLGIAIGLMLGLAFIFTMLGYGPLGYLACFIVAFMFTGVVAWKLRSIRIILRMEEI